MTRQWVADLWDDDPNVLRTSRDLEAAARRRYEALQRPVAPREAEPGPAAPPLPPTRRERIAALIARVRAGDRSAAATLRELLDEPADLRNP